MKNVLLLFLLVFSLSLHAQYNVNMPANHWVDSVFNTLTDTAENRPADGGPAFIHRPADGENHLL